MLEVNPRFIDLLLETLAFAFPINGLSQYNIDLPRGINERGRGLLGFSIDDGTRLYPVFGDLFHIRQKPDIGEFFFQKRGSRLS